MRIFSNSLVLGLVFSLSVVSFSVEARNSQRAKNANSILASNTPDYALLKALNERKQVSFIEGSELKVVKLLPDDTSGLRHQKWTVKLSDGRTLQAIYNLDMCERVPVKLGDSVAMGGQFIWTKQGGILHWLHRDPKRLRPDGYVHLNGKFFCK